MRPFLLPVAVALAVSVVSSAPVRAQAVIYTTDSYYRSALPVTRAVAAPVVTQSVVVEPVVTRSVVVEREIVQPVVTRSVVVEPVLTRTVIVEPAVTRSVVLEPVTTRSVVVDRDVVAPRTADVVRGRTVYRSRWVAR